MTSWLWMTRCTSTRCSWIWCTGKSISVGHRRTCWIRWVSSPIFFQIFGTVLVLGHHLLDSALLSKVWHCFDKDSRIEAPSLRRTHQFSYAHFCRGQIAIILADHHENCRSYSRFIHECSFCTNEHEIHLVLRNISAHRLWHFTMIVITFAFFLCHTHFAILRSSLHSLTSTCLVGNPLWSTSNLGTLRFATPHALAPQASSLLLDVTPILHFKHVVRSLPIPWKPQRLSQRLSSSVTVSFSGLNHRESEDWRLFFVQVHADTDIFVRSGSCPLVRHLDMVGWGASSCTHIKPVGWKTESVSEWKRVDSHVHVSGHLCQNEK